MLKGDLIDRHAGYSLQPILYLAVYPSSGCLHTGKAENLVPGLKIEDPWRTILPQFMSNGQRSWILESVEEDGCSSNSSKMPPRQINEPAQCEIQQAKGLLS